MISQVETGAELPSHDSCKEMEGTRKVT